MNGEEKFQVWTVGIVTTGIVMVLLGLMLYGSYQSELFVKGGYTEDTVQGSSTVRWIKK